MMTFKFNDKFLKNLEQGWQVPLGGTEEAAVSSVMAQMRKAGMQPNRQGVTKHVREVRAKAQSGK